MAKFKVLRKFRDKETKKIYEKGQEIEMTVKRAEEAMENLARHNDEFLERIDNKKEDAPKKEEKETTKGD